MRVFATAAAVAFAAMVAWSSSAQAVDVEIHGYPFGCKTPDGETRKPKFGDVGGMYFTGLPAARKACLETIDRMIYSCGANTTFISHDLNNQYADCLPIFEQQAEWCARHFELQRSKCDAGGSSAPAEPAEAAAEPAVEPADVTMWALKRSNLRSGPGTDHAKVGLLEVGDEVQVTGKIGDWLRIEAPGGGDGFVYAPLLTRTDPVTALGPKCRTVGRLTDCWVEVSSKPDCYVWVTYLPDTFEELSWSGQCARGAAHGRGTIELRYSDSFPMRLTGTLSAGKLDGHIQINVDGELMGESFYVDGERQHYEDVGQKPETSELTSAAATAATVRAPDTASTGPLHGSITFSQEADGGYAWGIAWSFDSRAGALAEATGQCREYGGTGCEEAGWLENACGALAIGDGNGYGTGGGATTAEAERDALAQCRAANADCRVEVARCSQSEEAGGRVRVESKTVTIVGYDLNQFSCVTDYSDTQNIRDFTLEIPQESLTCASLFASIFASCAEMCGYDELREENKQCLRHFKKQYEKCGPVPLDWFDPSEMFRYWGI